MDKNTGSEGSTLAKNNSLYRIENNLFMTFMWLFGQYVLLWWLLAQSERYCWLAARPVLCRLYNDGLPVTRSCAL